jgi:hypothetical protein
MSEQTSAPQPRGTRVETRIEVAAPASAIWALLADVDGWSRWNPLYAASRGALRVGEVLHLSVVLPGIAKPQTAPSTVKWVAAGTGVHYQSVSMGGMVLGNRYVTIEPAGPGGSTVINGEVMGGTFGWLIAALMGKKVAQALEGMNAALKAEAEEG